MRAADCKPESRLAIDMRHLEQPFQRRVYIPSLRRGRMAPHLGSIQAIQRVVRNEGLVFRVPHLCVMILHGFARFERDTP